MKKVIQNLSNHVKQGDTVKVISGKDKGKIGEITKILKNENKVVVKEINIKRKHVKPRKGEMLVKFHNLKLLYTVQM